MLTTRADSGWDKHVKSKKQRPNVLILDCSCKHYRVTSPHTTYTAATTTTTATTSTSTTYATTTVTTAIATATATIAAI